MNHFPKLGNLEPLADDSPDSKADFFELFPLCSALVAMIGKDTVDRWTRDEAESQRAKFCRRMVSQGFQEILVDRVWEMVVDQVEVQATVPNKLRPVPTSPERGESSRDAETESQNIFCFEAGRWIVKYAGKTVYPSNVTGLKYLHKMISTPGHSYRPEELYQNVSGTIRGTQEINGSPMSHSVAAEVGLSAHRAKPDVHVDERGRREMLVRIEEIEIELENAKRIPDPDQIERLVVERLKIVAYLKKAFTPLGSRKIQEPESVRKMKAIDIAVRRAKEKIRLAGHSKLLDHLQEAITVRSRSGCCYHPLGEPKWRTEPISPPPPSLPR